MSSLQPNTPSKAKRKASASKHRRGGDCGTKTNKHFRFMIELNFQAKGGGRYRQAFEVPQLVYDRVNALITGDDECIFTISVSVLRSKVSMSVKTSSECVENAIAGRSAQLFHRPASCRRDRLHASASARNGKFSSGSRGCDGDQLDSQRSARSVQTGVGSCAIGARARGSRLNLVVH